MMKLLIQIIFIVILSPVRLQAEATSPAASTVCKKMTTHSTTKRPPMMLVHGFTGGGWAWYRVRCSLESMGYNVTSIDLKGCGIDPTDANTIENFEQYNEPLDRFMAHLPQHEKIVLVGHSAGGVSLTKILHDYPDKVQLAIYISATMLRNGFTTCEHLIMGVPHFNESKCVESCPKLPDTSCFQKVIVPPLKREDPLGSMEEYMLQRSLARVGPFRAIVSSKFPDKATGANHTSIDKIPRVYIKTMYDRTLTPDQQDAMLKLWPPCEVREITNDHDCITLKPEVIAGFIVNATLTYSA